MSTMPNMIKALLIAVMSGVVPMNGGAEELFEAKVVKDPMQPVMAASSGHKSGQAELLSTGERVSIRVPIEISLKDGELVKLSKEVIRLRGREESGLREITIYEYVARTERKDI